MKAEVKEVIQALDNYAINTNMNERAAIVRQSAYDVADKKDLKMARDITNHLPKAGDLIGLEILAALGWLFIENEEEREEK